MALDDEIQILSETEEYYKALFFGDPGGGKTKLSAEFPEPIRFDYERSSDTLRHYPALRNQPIIRPRRIEGATPANRWSKTHKLVEEVVKDGRFETIIFDTYQGLCRTCEDEITVKQNKKLPDWPVWREVLDIQTDFVDWLQDIDMHVIYITHVKTRQDELTKEIEIQTNLTPGINEMLYKMCNLVGYLQVNTSLQGVTTRKMLVTAGGKQQAKNRLRLKDAYILEPTFAKLQQAERETT